ncbi:MAG: peroxiredoxin-like family protein [Pseudomonadota bacterium]
MSRILPLLLLALSAVIGPVNAEVAENEWSIRPLMPGAEAPAFEATAADGSTFAFDPKALERPALFVFYRGGWCPYCNLHLAELRHIEDDLKAAGVDLIFLSADSPEVIAEAVEDGEALSYTLLSDATAEAAQAFGISFQVPGATVVRLRERGIVDMQPVSGTTDVFALPAPATYLVGTDGIIKFSFVNPDYKVRVSNEVLLAAAQTMPERVIRR